jgi:NADH-quinone oxidoreductase subunit H
VGLFVIYGSVRLGTMVEWQGENAWGIFVQPFAFFLFLAALAAETKRVPFDQPEGESEIVAGYFVEYSGMKFGMFFMGEYIDLFVSSAILVTLFFGGYQLPFLHADGITVAFGDTRVFDYRMTHISVVIISALVFFGKTVLMTWVQVFFRWTLPRFRYDQLMTLGWKALLPLALLNLFWVAALEMWRLRS